jgi:hypothetical protein
MESELTDSSTNRAESEAGANLLSMAIATIKWKSRFRDATLNLVPESTEDLPHSQAEC